MWYIFQITIGGLTIAATRSWKRNKIYYYHTLFLIELADGQNDHNISVQSSRAFVLVAHSPTCM